jgi:hypothetical protein
MKFMRKSALILAIAPLVFAIAVVQIQDKQQIPQALQRVLPQPQQLEIVGIVLKVVVR